MTTAAVLGCGDVSVVHLEAIEALPEVRLAAVCDTDSDRAAAAGDRYRVPAFDDHRRLLESVRPDVVHVCTPHHQHADLVIDALEAGVHVVLEKPVAHTVAEAERVIAAAERHPHLKVGVCLQNRYNATAQAMHTLLRSGEVGGVVGASATVLWHRSADYYRSRPWRGRLAESGGGVLVNQAIHALDLLLWLVGDVTRVRGLVGTHVLDGGVDGGVDIEDTAQIVLDHETGVRSVLFATVAHAVDSPVTLEVVTEKAVLFVRGDLSVTHADGRAEVVGERRASSAGRAYWGVSHELLIADFYRGLAQPEPFWIGPREAAKSLRIIDEVYAAGTAGPVGSPASPPAGLAGPPS